MTTHGAFSLPDIVSRSNVSVWVDRGEKATAISEPTVGRGHDPQADDEGKEAHHPIGDDDQASVPPLDLVVGGCRKSRDELARIPRSGKDWAAAATIGGKKPRAAKDRPTAL